VLEILAAAGAVDLACAAPGQAPIEPCAWPLSLWLSSVGSAVPAVPHVVDAAVGSLPDQAHLAVGALVNSSSSLYNVGPALQLCAVLPPRSERHPGFPGRDFSGLGHVDVAAIGDGRTTIVTAMPVPVPRDTAKPGDQGMG